MAPVTPSDVPAPPTFDDDFDGPTLGGEWISIRRLPGERGNGGGGR